MPIDPVLRDQLNRQITNERFNAAFYLATATRLELANLIGLAVFMRDAATEEQDHARRLIGYLIDRNEIPIIAPLDAPSLPTGAEMINIGTLMFSAALAREQQVTAQINYLYLLSLEVKDPQTAVMLEWFISEQTRSERELVELVARLRFAEGCPSGVLQIDHELDESEKP